MMRLFVVAVLISGCLGSRSSGAELLSVEVRANKETKYAAVATVLSAIGSGGITDNVALAPQDAEGVSAQIRASTQAPYADLAKLLNILSKAGVRSITIDAQ